MIRWETERPTLPKYERIHCFTCKQDVSKRELRTKAHQGHEAHYLKADGSLDE